MTSNQIDTPFSDTLERIWCRGFPQYRERNSTFLYVYMCEYLFMLLQHVYVCMRNSYTFIYGRAHRFRSFSLARSLPIQILAMNEPQTPHSRYIVDAFSYTLMPQWSSFKDRDCLVDLFYIGIITKLLVNLKLSQNIGVKRYLLFYC